MSEKAKSEMKLKLSKFREYLDYIEEHYDNVQKAWQLINEKCRNGFRFIYDDWVWECISQGVRQHDLSKLSAEEFTQYRNYFYPFDGEEKNKDDFEKAWQHHLEKNDHHWQNWTKNHENHPYADAFVVLNVVDWVAMSFKFGGTAKDYYEKNKDKINIPDWAVELMYEIFECIYK